jgi:hypothetical protein
MFQAIVSALLSISLAQLILCLPSIARRLEQLDGASYRRQIDSYRESMLQSRRSPELLQDVPIKTQSTSIASTSARSRWQDST